MRTVPERRRRREEWDVNHPPNFNIKMNKKNTVIVIETWYLGFLTCPFLNGAVWILGYFGDKYLEENAEACRVHKISMPWVSPKGSRVWRSLPSCKVLRARFLFHLPSRENLHCKRNVWERGSRGNWFLQDKSSQSLREEREMLWLRTLTETEDLNFLFIIGRKHLLPLRSKLAALFSTDLPCRGN